MNERVKRRSNFVETRRGKEKERRTSISRTHSVHLEPSHARRSTHENPVNEMSSFGRVERKDETGSSGEGCELDIETRVEERMIDDGQLFQFSQTLRWSIEKERERERKLTYPFPRARVIAVSVVDLKCFASPPSPASSCERGEGKEQNASQYSFLKRRRD